MTRPTDDELDAHARAVPPYRPGAAQLERARTGLLAAAADVTPRAARTIDPRDVIAVSLAAAAGLALWLAVGREPGPHASRATLAAAPGTRSTVASGPPDEIVRLADGELTIEVAPLGAGERFRLITSDAEVEVRGTRFVVAASADVLTKVQVIYGVVEVRPAGRPSVTLREGEQWPAVVQTADRASGLGPRAPGQRPTPAPAIVEPADEPVIAKPRTKSRAPSEPPRQASSEPEARGPSPDAPSPAAPPAAPGEADFRAGWDAMKRGDHAVAAASFAASRTAKASAVVEDATFWEGIALARAGRSAQAIAALHRFVTAYPRSARHGEASARLGWLLLDAGDPDAAAARFRAAADDAVASVRESAASGLAKIEAGK